MKIELREVGTFFGYLIFLCISSICFSVIGIEIPHPNRKPDSPS